VLSKRRKSYPTQMARDFGAVVGAHVDDVGVLLESSDGLLFLGMMIIMSLSIILMVIFACADGIPRNRRGGGGSGGNGGGGNGGGGGGNGGGGNGGGGGG
jgi:uncharacterized membrane protein YgcG